MRVHHRVVSPRSARPGDCRRYACRLADTSAPWSGARHFGDGGLPELRAEPWHDKNTRKTFLRPDTGKCLHYYFYWMDAKPGLTYLRVPTHCPFRLQFYCNGHSRLPRPYYLTLFHSPRGGDTFGLCYDRGHLPILFKPLDGMLTCLRFITVVRPGPRGCNAPAALSRIAARR